jgi:hypothetical protein
VAGALSAAGPPPPDGPTRRKGPFVHSGAHEDSLSVPCLISPWFYDLGVCWSLSYRTPAYIVSYVHVLLARTGYVSCASDGL